jgi:hypothetical protein
MATFDNIVAKSDNFNGYEGNPPTTETEYDALNCWVDSTIAPTWASMVTGMALAEVQQDRAVAYPPMADQLDDIFHNGVAGWKKTIQAVKDTYPKP